MKRRSLVLIEIDCAWSDERLEQTLESLPTAVKARAARYRHSGARRNLIATQHCLRQVIAHLGEDPDQIRVMDNGRPTLCDSAIEFNLSHSADRGVLVVGRSEELDERLGVDLEEIGRTVDRPALARRFFTSAERDYADRGAQEFFFVWTRKEAILKSNGIGLRVPLDSFDVLDDEVAQEVTGHPLALKSVERGSGFMVSCAVPKSWSDSPVFWVEAFTPGWLIQTAEGIDA